jgi:protein gp37
MSDQSPIEWTDATWNPVRGCSKISAGCKNCYAERFAERFRGVKGHPFEQGFDVRLVPEALDLPLRWRKPRSVFVNSMSDLFHEDVPDELIAAVFGVMAAAPRHSFQVLTKRADRLPRWFAWLEEMAGRCKAVFSEDPLEWRRAHILRAAGLRQGVHHEASAGDMEARGWPLPNVWLGVSVEDQRAADERIPHLLATPAAVRFLSCEPLLGPVNLGDALTRVCCRRPDLAPATGCDGPGCMGTRIDWVIVGGESGPGARPCDVAWIRSLVAQCRAANVAAFVKQLGAYVEDRNDAGFEGERPAEWPMDTATEDLDDGHYQGAPVRIHLRDRKGGDPAEWPEDLRVRELPEVRRG